MSFVSPATHAMGMVSVSQSALQSAELNHMSRTGVLFVVFHHCVPVCRSQRAMYDPSAGTVNGTATLVVAPGASCGSAAVAAFGTATSPFDRRRYDTFVPAGIAACPRFVTITRTVTTAPGKPGLGGCGAMYGRATEPGLRGFW